MAELYLVPSFLDESLSTESLSPHFVNSLRNIDLFFVENEKSARAYLKKLNLSTTLQNLTLRRLDKDTTESDLKNYILEIKERKLAGVISEAGCPCIADPGAALVALAHEQGVNIKPLVGPSSIILALMASGFNGQSFSFHGYLPIERQAKLEKLKALESESASQQRTQIFIETPYRNNQLLSDILSTCLPSTRLCVAADLTSPSEQVVSQTISKWKEQSLDFNKHPAVFLLIASHK